MMRPGFTRWPTAWAGTARGEVASRIAVDTVVRHVTAVCEKAEKDPSVCLEEAALLANAAVLKNVRAHPARQGMGATLSMVKIAENRLFAANVGDSPIFLVRRGDIRLLYTSHTLEAPGSWTPGPANQWAKPPTAHVLTRAVGVENHGQPDFAQMDAKPGDRLVLCSDGLSDKSSFEEIAQTLAATSPQEACQTLVDLALSRGGDDTTSPWSWCIWIRGQKFGTLVKK